MQEKQLNIRAWDVISLIGTKMTAEPIGRTIV